MSGNDGSLSEMEDDARDALASTLSVGSLEPRSPAVSERSGARSELARALARVVDSAPVAEYRTDRPTARHAANVPGLDILDTEVKRMEDVYNGNSEEDDGSESSRHGSTECVLCQSSLSCGDQIIGMMVEYLSARYSARIISSNHNALVHSLYTECTAYKRHITGRSRDVSRVRWPTRQMIDAHFSQHCKSPYAEVIKNVVALESVYNTLNDIFNDSAHRPKILLRISAEIRSVSLAILAYRRQLATIEARADTARERSKELYKKLQKHLE